MAPDARAPAPRASCPTRRPRCGRPDNEGEYLVITTEALKETAQTLADYRSDLRSQVVDIEDVYDEFNHGIASPYALQGLPDLRPRRSGGRRRATSCWRATGPTTTRTSRASATT